jgi:hypothetical protein
VRSGKIVRVSQRRPRASGLSALVGRKVQYADYAEAEMSRYFFHLRTDENFVWDNEGVDLPDPLTAQGAADKTAAELRGGLLHQVPHDSCWTVTVTDESGEIIHTVAL